ncbi:hypothetical protein I4U23_022079 [Adineta vaga]|nr:hypothetical protein I4U23_022079 [Adineta vaga]
MSIVICILLRQKNLYNIQLLLCTNNHIISFLLGILPFTINIRIFQGGLIELNLIMKKKHHLNSNLIHIKQSPDRDMIIFRRNIIVILMLGVYGITTCIMLLILAFTNKLVTCFYRALVLSVSICVFKSSFAIKKASPSKAF